MAGMAFPQVLLIGNGINRAFSGGSWADILSKIGDNPGVNIKDSQMPMPLLAISATGGDVGSRLKEHSKHMYGSVEGPRHRELLQKVLELGADHILTTNYSYELESAALQKNCVTDTDLKKKLQTFNKTRDIRRAESKYLLHTYNKVLWKGEENRIWHIHGEARKPDSMILGHYYYGSLLFKYKELLDKRKDAYLRAQKHNRVYPVHSWLDAFITGDIYVLGFGFDLSEFDLWWLLNRKNLEKAATGTVYYFAPKNGEDTDKAKLLKTLGVQCIDLGFEYKGSQADGSSEDTNSFYLRFYEKALERISSEIENRRK